MTVEDEPRTEDAPEQPPALPPEGWFADPEWPGWLRWWDGERWTEHRTRDPSTIPSQTVERTSGWAIAALVTGALGIVFVAIACAIVAKRRIKESKGTLGGEGLANAGIILASAYAVGFAILLLAGAFAGHEKDAGGFQGTRRQVAVVVDRFERAIDKDDGDFACSDLLTAGFAAKIERGSGKSCATAVVDAVAKGAFQAEIDVRSITIDGDVATARVREGGDRQTWTMRREGGAWRIDSIRSS